MSLPLFALLVSAYFAAHGINSVTAQKLLVQEINDLEAEQHRISMVREDLELHVGLLSSNHVDPDYLDELARRDLGFSHPDEIIITNKK
ncbi:MAG: septum formation initiator family protein [Emcibacteraceae bacterium]|nr:septum formation initiator family protein [Emcibacteraceae bacterium]